MSDSLNWHFRAVTSLVVSNSLSYNSLEIHLITLFDWCLMSFEQHVIYTMLISNIQWLMKWERPGQTAVNNPRKGYTPGTRQVFDEDR